MPIQLRDNLLAVTIKGSGATHYRVAHDSSLNAAAYQQLPVPDVPGTYVVRHDIPAIPGTYPVEVQIRNSLHESNIISNDVVLLSNINPAVSTLRNKLRIAQSFGPNVTPSTYCNEIKCFHSFVSLYNNSENPIDLSSVKIWTRYQNATSVPVYGTDGITITGYTTNPDSPAQLTPWKSSLLSGTIASGKYFLILGPRVASDKIMSDGKSVEQILFTTAPEGTNNFFVDLDLSASSDFYVSSKLVEIVLTDASVSSLPDSIYASGAFCSGFIDLYGVTASTSTVAEENFSAPDCIFAYFNNNSKQQLKTIIDPTKEALSNLADYTSTSIKSLTSATIRTSVPCRPRNSNFTGVFV